MVHFISRKIVRLESKEGNNKIQCNTNTSRVFLHGFYVCRPKFYYSAIEVYRTTPVESP